MRCWLVVALLLCMGTCHAEQAAGQTGRAPIQEVRRGNTMQFVIHYPKPTSNALPAYHGTALSPPPPAAAPAPPPFPIKVPKFASKLARKFDALKARFNKLANPQVRVSKTQGTLSGDMSATNKQLTLKVPFDTGQVHPFENMWSKGAAAPPTPAKPSPTPFQ
ncbi:MAG: hypothetical protein ACYCW6_10400 [Candidatus Xenobia bacterium]